MRFGIFGFIVSGLPEKYAKELIAQPAEIGYDYLELSLALLMLLPADEFNGLRRRVENAGFGVEVCHGFFPRVVRLAGPYVDWRQVVEYTHRAVGYAAELGVKVLVFGSPHARNVMEGFPMYRAWQQLEQVLRLVADEAAPYGISVVIEPISRQTSNIVNSLGEGLALMRRVGRPEVRVMADYRHMMASGEDLGILQTAGADLRHIHFRRVAGQGYPTEVEPGFVDFFRQLKAAGYDGRVSVDGAARDFYGNGGRALALLKSLT